MRNYFLIHFQNLIPGLDLDGIESLNFEDFINVSDRQL